MRRALATLLLLLISVPLWAQPAHPILALGSAAPDFALPGVDGKIHKLSDYAASPVLVVIFTCNHCPIAQMYERRIEQLYEDYGKKGVAVVAIQGNDPKAIRIDELDSSDVSDTLDDMKIRVAYKHLHYPYLYAGRHAVRHQLRTAHRQRRTSSSSTRPAAFAIRAALTIAIASRRSRRTMRRTRLMRCWPGRQCRSRIPASSDARRSGRRNPHSVRRRTGRSRPTPVHLEKVDAAGSKSCAPTTSGKVTFIDFWATWCGSCLAEFSDLQDTYRMYSNRDFNLVTVSANMPDEEPSVLRFLQKKHATSRNLLFASDDTEKLQAAFDPAWQSAVPYTVVLGPDGKVIYKTIGSVDLLEMRRKILAAMPSDYIGFNKYWAAGN